MSGEEVPEVLVRFWAGARRAAGHEQEVVAAATVGQLREQLAARPALAGVAAVASFLVDGQQAGETTPLSSGSEVDVLPPFAGGAPLILGIGGSTSSGSVTTVLLRACLTEVAALGARTDRSPAPRSPSCPSTAATPTRPGRRSSWTRCGRRTAC